MQIEPLIITALKNKSDYIIFSFDGDQGIFYVKENMSLAKLNDGFSKEHSFLIAESLSQFFNKEDDFKIINKNLQRTYEYENTLYDLVYILNTNDSKRFEVSISIKNLSTTHFTQVKKQIPAFIKFEKLIEIAIEKGASDVQIQTYVPTEDRGSDNGFIRFRINGRMEDHEENLDYLETIHLLRVIYNVTYNKDIEDNDTANFMNVFYKSIIYKKSNETFRLGYASNQTNPDGVCGILKIMPSFD